jgi:hypothetical protein
LDKGETRRFITYTKPGSSGAEIIVFAEDRTGRTYHPPDAKRTFVGELGQEIFLTLGFRSQDLGQALRTLGKHRNQDDRQKLQRSACYAAQVEDLPTRWYGYDAVDVLILPTGNRAFLTRLVGDRGRRQALGEWVRRGGRLVLSVAENGDLAAQLLQSWQPAPPPVFTGQRDEVTALDNLRQFADAQGKPFHFGEGVRAHRVARLETRRAEVGPVEVLTAEGPSHPLLVRAPYGRGSITYLAMDLDRGPLTTWDGRQDLLKNLIHPAERHRAAGS